MFHYCDRVRSFKWGDEIIAMLSFFKKNYTNGSEEITNRLLFFQVDHTKNEHQGIKWIFKTYANGIWKAVEHRDGTTEMAKNFKLTFRKTHLRFP